MTSDSSSSVSSFPFLLLLNLEAFLMPTRAPCKLNHCFAKWSPLAFGSGIVTLMTGLPTKFFMKTHEFYKSQDNVMTSSPQGPNHRIWAQPGRPGPPPTREFFWLYLKWGG